MLVFKGFFVLSLERKNCDTFYARVQRLFRVEPRTQELWYFLCSCSKALPCRAVNARIVILFMLVLKGSAVSSRECKNCDTFYARVRRLFRVESWSQELWYFLCSCSKACSCWVLNARIVILFMLVFKGFFVLSSKRKNSDTFYARVQRLFRVEPWTQELWYFLCSWSKAFSCRAVNARIVILFMLVLKGSSVSSRERKNCDTFYARVQRLFRVEPWTQELWYFLCSCSKALPCRFVNARIVILYMLVFKGFFVSSRKRKNCDTFYARVQRLFRVEPW
jgi:hypothetical protein